MPTPTEPTLRRTVTLPLLVFYGVGTIVGGGFYALVGKVAGEAGGYAPMAWLVSAAVATLSALSYASLSKRLPFSAGEAEYVRAAFGKRALSTAVGWLVILTGLVSAATLARAIVGFLRASLDVPLVPSLCAVVLLLGAIAAWGIAEAVWVSVVITILEVGGLLLVVGLQAEAFAELPARWRELVPPLELEAWHGVGLGAFLGFYAFIGFEDMVNVVEEVRAPERTMPRAILLSVLVSSVLYVLAASVAVLAVPLEELVASETPFARVVADHGPRVSGGIVVVSTLAGVNGALVQIIMASRVGYGMAERGGAPAWLKRIHARTRTPLLATAVMTAAVLALALWFPLTTLAKGTSAIILLVFTLVNLALFAIRRREAREDPAQRLRARDGVALLGAAACLGFLALQVQAWLA